MASSPAPSASETVRAASTSISATVMAAPSSRRRMAMARPIPEPAPVTSAILPVSGFGLGRRWSLRSSSTQYSMRNFSASEIGAYVDRASAPRIALIAAT